MAHWRRFWPQEQHQDPKGAPVRVAASHTRRSPSSSTRASASWGRARPPPRRWAVNIGSAEGLTQVGLGEGEMDLVEIFRAAKGKVKYYTYEWDWAPSFESLAKSYEYLDTVRFWLCLGCGAASP